MSSRSASLKYGLCFVFILIVSAIAQEPGQDFKYRVDNFCGGLNLAGDSTDLANNESLVLKNFILTQNSIESRHGISTWNSTVIDTNGTPVKIDNIFFYEPYPDTFRTMIVAGGFIYICPTLADPGSVDWDTLRLGFADSGLSVTNGSQIATNERSWSHWYTNINSGDRIIINSNEYVLTLSDNSDELLTLSSNYSGATDDSIDYEIVKVIKGVSSFEQNKDKLYISDSYGFTIEYDDTTYRFIALVDSGTIDSLHDVDTTIVAYNEGTVRVEKNSNIVRGWRDNDFTNVSNDSSMIFVLMWHVPFRVNRSHIGVHGGRWASEILNIDTLANTLELADAVNLLDNNGQPIAYFNVLEDQKYEIVRKVSRCNVDATSRITDVSKNWYDDQYGDQYLTNLQFVYEKEGFNEVVPAFCNAENSFQIDTFTTSLQLYADSCYYIFAKGCPYSGSVFIPELFPFFEQVFFYQDQLFGFGSDMSGGAWFFDSTAFITYPSLDNKLNRVWYSEISIYPLIKSNYIFDVGTKENITAHFELYSGHYLAAKNSFWRFGGTPQTDVNDGDLRVRQVASNIGISELDDWAQATLGYIYFADETGLYYFAGSRPQKISQRVDPLFEKYGKSDMLLGYYSYEDQLFVSWADSGVSLIYDENFETFIGTFDFGMTCMNQQSADLDTNIFFFGHADTLGYVFFYPNTAYVDSMPDTVLNIAYDYKSGHQSHGDYSYPKKVREVSAAVQSPGTMTLYIYNDFSSTPADSFVTDSTGNFVYIPSFDRGKAFGEYVQYGIEANAGEKVIIRDYEVLLQWLIRFTK